MKRTPMPPRKTAIRRKSHKAIGRKQGHVLRRQAGPLPDEKLTAQQYAARYRHDRNGWRDLMPQRCMWCGKSEREATCGLTIHEMERKSHAPRRWAKRINYLLLCWEPCHRVIFDSMPHAAQLAIKKLHDPRHYKLKAWHAIGGRPLTYVTQAEVNDWINTNSEAAT